MLLQGDDGKDRVGVQLDRLWHAASKGFDSRWRDRIR